MEDRSPVIARVQSERAFEKLLHPRPVVSIELALQRWSPPFRIEIARQFVQQAAQEFAEELGFDACD